MVTLGSVVGGFIPSLWGDSMFSYASIFSSTIGGVVGIWAGMRISDVLN